MAEAGNREDEDNILAHLLPANAAAASAYAFIEEEEEEVNYSETDEDVLSVDPSGSGRAEASQHGAAQEDRSPSGAQPAAAEKKQHVPISWHSWQGPSAGGVAEERGSKRRRSQDAAVGARESSRERRLKPRSRGRSRGRESTSEWRDRILREAAAERDGRPDRQRLRERSSGSRQRREREPGQGREEHREQGAARSRDADPEKAAATRDCSREGSKPRIGPAGPRELDKTREEVEQRRARKKTSIWDVDAPVDAPAAVAKDSRTEPADAGAGKPRQRSGTPPGPPPVRPPPPPAFNRPHSPRRSQRSISPPLRCHAVLLDSLRPPMRAGSPLPWERPPGPWRLEPRPWSPPRAWHPTERGRSPPRDWPPHHFRRRYPEQDPFRRDLLPPPSRPGEWDSGAPIRHRSGPLDPLPPPPHHLGPAPFQRGASPGRERPGPGWHPRDPPPPHMRPSSPPFRCRDSPPRRARASPAFGDSRLRPQPRRGSSPERCRGRHGADGERRPRHICGGSPAGRRGGSAERKPDAAAAKSSRLQSKVSAMEASAGCSEKAKDGSSGAATAATHAAQNGGREAEASVARGSRLAGKEATAGHTADASTATKAQQNGAAAEDSGKSKTQRPSQRRGDGARDRDAAAKRDSHLDSPSRRKDRERRETSTAAAKSGGKPSSSAAAAKQAAPDAERGRSSSKGNAAKIVEQSFAAAEPGPSGRAQKAASDAPSVTEQKTTSKKDATEKPGGKQQSKSEQTPTVAPTGVRGPNSATAVDPDPSIPAAAWPQAGQGSDVPPASQDKGSRPSKRASESTAARDSRARTPKDADMGRKDDDWQPAAKYSRAGDSSERKSSGTKRAREEAHDSRRRGSSVKRHSEASTAARTDRDRGKAAANGLKNGNSHAADSKATSNDGAALPGPPPLPLSRLSGSAGPSVPTASVLDESSKEWMYCDPRGETQGPCSVADFKKWLGRMRVDPTLRKEYEEFQKCLIWRKNDGTTRTPLIKLLD